jgi:hypothetical protein
MTTGSQYLPSLAEDTARTAAAAGAPDTAREDLAWERRWQAEWDRRNIED